MKSFREYISEAKQKGFSVETKDWERMMDLLLAGKDGEDVAAKINDKDKALARYIAGTKLHGKIPTKVENSYFDAFGLKAIKLGATEEEIMELLKSTEVPSQVASKLEDLKTSKLDNRFVGAISKAIIKMGFSIKYLSSGDAITNDGKEAMRRNGRKWTIGYKAEVDVGSEKLPFVFDAITDEGGGSTSYVIANIGKDYARKDKMGQREFLEYIETQLSKYK